MLGPAPVSPPVSHRQRPSSGSWRTASTMLSCHRARPAGRYGRPPSTTRRPAVSMTRRVSCLPRSVGSVGSTSKHRRRTVQSCREWSTTVSWGRPARGPPGSRGGCGGPGYRGTSRGRSTGKQVPAVVAAPDADLGLGQVVDAGDLFGRVGSGRYPTGPGTMGVPGKGPTRIYDRLWGCVHQTA